MIRIDAAWLAAAPLDMRAGTDTALARVVTVFGAVHPHHAYLFANCHDPVGSPWMMEDTAGVRASTGRGRSIL